MLKTVLRFLRLRIQKAIQISKEDIDMRRYINEVSEKKIMHCTEPFEYIVIDDFFTKETYEGIARYVESVKNRGYSEKPSANKFYPFKYVTGYLEKYGGYFYPPKYKEDPFSDIFFSVSWNIFIEKMIGRFTNECVSTTLHIHTNGNSSGWVHTDNQEIFFNEADRISNGMVLQSNYQKNFTLKVARSVAVLYYCCNDGWREGDGGETGIFKSPEDLEPYKKIEPINNRLLIMKISPKSYHAFMGNKTTRHAFVQWFHQDTLCS